MTAHHFLKHDGALISYYLQGNGPVRLMLIHGLLGDAREWDAVISGLKGCGTVAIDLRGHGATQAAPADITFDHLVDDVIAVTRRTADEPVILVGQSMGGVVAFAASTRHPALFAALVLVESGIGAGGAGALGEVVANLSALPAFMTADEYERAFEGSAAELAVASYVADGLVWRRRWDLEAMRSIMEGVFADDRRADWIASTVPKTLVVAQDSEIDGAEIAALRRDRPTCELVVASNAGHEVHLDQPEILTEVLLQLVYRENATGNSRRAPYFGPRLGS